MSVFCQVVHFDAVSKERLFLTLYNITNGTSSVNRFVRYSIYDEKKWMPPYSNSTKYCVIHAEELHKSELIIFPPR